MLLSMSCHLPCSPSLCINLSHQRPSLHHQKSKPEGADGWRGWGMWQFVHLGYHRDEVGSFFFWNDEVGSWPSVQVVLPPRLNMPRSKNILLSTAVVMLVFTKRTWLICSTCYYIWSFVATSDCQNSHDIGLDWNSGSKKRFAAHREDDPSLHFASDPCLTQTFLQAFLTFLRHTRRRRRSKHSHW